jgi:hypothetical protein
VNSLNPRYVKPAGVVSRVLQGRTWRYGSGAGE